MMPLPLSRGAGGAFLLLAPLPFKDLLGAHIPGMGDFSAEVSAGDEERAVRSGVRDGEFNKTVSLICLSKGVADCVPLNFNI